MQKSILKHVNADSQWRYWMNKVVAVSKRFNFQATVFAYDEFYKVEVTSHQNEHEDNTLMQQLEFSSA